MRWYLVLDIHLTNAHIAGPVGGEIGITPLMSMAVRLHELGTPFELHYCVRSRRAGAFIEELAASQVGYAMRLHFDDEGAEQRLTIAEYKNMAGRAGRLGFNETGKAIILADTPVERAQLFQRYVQGAPEDVVSSFKIDDLPA